MVIILFHFFLISSVAAVGLGPASPYPDGCQPTSCKRGGPSVRFPFRLKGRQPDGCDYYGFNLTCNNGNHTNQLQNLKLSSSPFNLSSDSDYYAAPQNFTLFECLDGGQSAVDDYDTIPCLSTKPGFHVKYTDSDYASTDLLHCRRTIDLRDVPGGLVWDQRNNFYFNWSRPACGYCEARRQGCRRNDTNASGFECFDIPIKDMGPKEKLMISGLTIGGCFLVTGLVGLLWMSHLRKNEKNIQRKIEQFLEDYKALKPSRYSYADIKRISRCELLSSNSS
ncbi:hypothetical protein V6N13_012840 [Hibiscus sabdariffa]